MADHNTKIAWTAAIRIVQRPLELEVRTRKLGSNIHSSDRIPRRSPYDHACSPDMWSHVACNGSNDSLRREPRVHPDTINQSTNNVWRTELCRIHQLGYTLN